MKMFCFAKKIKISNFQNVTFDVIRDRIVKQHIFQKISNAIYHTYAKSQTFFVFQRSNFDFLQNETTTTNSFHKKSIIKYFFSITINVIIYAYQNTSKRSFFKKSLTNIFVYNIKFETLYENIFSLFIEFIRDVFLIIMKRLFFKLKIEKAKFDKNVEKYHLHDLSNSRNDRTQKSFENKKIFNESIAKIVIVDENDT